jgi:hypothetical protein
MLILRKSLLKRIGIISLMILAAILAAAFLVRHSLAATTVTIVTPPKETIPIIIDNNHNGINEQSELLGTFPVFDGNKEMVFAWTPFSFPANSNGSYRVSLWQNTTPFASKPTWTEIKVAHYWADDPNGPKFTLGSFGFGETVCTVCPTMFVAIPETYTTTYDPATFTTTFTYTTLSPLVAGVLPANAQTSPLFFIEIVREQCGATLGLTACNNYCIKKGGDFQICMSTCQGQLMPFSLFNFETCTCTINANTCTALGKSFIKELCLCQ